MHCKGGGIWHADAGALSLLRQHICEDPGKFKGILADPRIAKNLLSIKGNVTTAKAVSAFTSYNSEDALKTAPKVLNGIFSGKIRSNGV